MNAGFANQLNGLRAFRVWDLLLYGATVVFVLLAFFCVTMQKSEVLNGIYGSIDGKPAFFYAFGDDLVLYAENLSVEETEDTVTVTISFGDGRSVFQINCAERTARILRSDCPHGDCLNAEILRAGDAIVCLPYRLLIEGRGDSLPPPSVG